MEIFALSRVRFRPKWASTAHMVFLCLPALAPPGLSGQDPGSQNAVTERSARQALDLARDGQRDFERLRRRHLSPTDRWASGPCDARAGRMCWRHHTVLIAPPATEEPEVTEARDSLLHTLEAASRADPSDAWVLGQRVWYLLEAGWLEEARTIAAACGGPPTWWCRALEGLALHIQGRYPDAGQAFDEALGAMDPEEAAEWRDPTLILGGGARDFLEEDRGDGTETRDDHLRRLWSLSDPLFIVPGNDRRTEHLSRLVADRIFSEAATPHALPWGNDMAELMIRYGWERGWERILPRPGELDARGRVLGYEHPDVRDYIPPREVLARPTREAQDPWAPSMSGFARSGYAPAYAPTLLPMDSRLIVLTRGDHALVAATFRIPADTTMRTRANLRGDHLSPPAFMGWPVRAGFLLAESADAPLHALTADDRTEGVISMDVPSGDYLASVEVLDPEAGLAGRFRNGLRVGSFPPDVPVLSDLLLVEGDSLPQGTREALARLRIDQVVTMGEPLAVGWEIWGLGWREEMVRFRLTLEPERRGLLGRIRGLFGGRGTLPILDWEEPGPDAPGANFQAVSLTLPDLDEGDYVLRLQVTLAGREPMVSSLPFRVEEPGGTPEGEIP